MAQQNIGAETLASAFPKIQSNFDELYDGVANVKWFGAAGDGVTDDTSAFTTALAVVNEIYIPEGTFMVSDIYLDSNKRLFGVGKNKTFLKLNANATNGLIYTDKPYGIVERLCMLGNKANFTGHGFYTDGTALTGANFGITIRDCRITDFSGNGIHAKYINDFTVERSVVFGNNLSEIYIDAAHVFKIDNCDIESGSSLAIEIVEVTDRTTLDASDGTISNCYFEAFSGTDVISVDAKATTIKECHFGSMSTTNSIINVKEGGSNTTIEKNNLYSGPTNKVVVDSGAVGVRILGNKGITSTSSGAGIPTITGVSDAGSGTFIETMNPSNNTVVLKGEKVSVGGAYFNSTTGDMTISGNLTGAKNTIVASNTNTSLFGGAGVFRLRNSDNTINNYSIIDNTDAAGTINGGILFRNTDHVNHYGKIYFASRSSRGWSNNTMVIDGDMVGIKNDAPTEVLDVTGNVKATSYKLSSLNTAPASATDTGFVGDIRITATHIYVCTATDTWVRTELATW